MKNLFRRIYLKHDTDVLAQGNQKRLVISTTEFKYPFPTDAETMATIGLMGYFKGLEAVDERYADRETFWANLRATSERICIIADRVTLAKILIQYWKSIFRAATFEACYPLYTLFVNNENLLSLHSKTSVASDANVSATQVEPLTADEFRTLFVEGTAAWALSEMSQREIPIEYLLAAYFATPSKPMAAKSNLGKITFSKVKDIVLTNIVSQLVDAKKDYFLSTHNYHRLSVEGGESEVVTDPLSRIQSNEALSWVLDPDFRVDNINGIVAKYGLTKLREFFTTYTKLFDFEFEEAFALDYLIADDIPGLLEYDVQDDKGNFFGTEDHVFKINGLLVSFIYRQYRLGQKTELTAYALR